MSQIKYVARVGRSFIFPRITVTAYDASGAVVTGGLAGSVAVLTIGTGTTTMLTVRSDAAPTAPAAFTWNDSAQTLDVHLSPAQMTAIGSGEWTCVVDIEETDADVSHDVPTMTFGLKVLLWP